MSVAFAFRNILSSNVVYSPRTVQYISSPPRAARKKKEEGMDLSIKRVTGMAIALALAGCGGGGGGSVGNGGGAGGGGSGGTPQSQTVGGTASGVEGSGLTLQINGANDVAVNADGSFSFAALPAGLAYTVTVRTQPSAPRQSCSVTNGTGTIANAPVTNVAVSCRTLVGKFLFVPNVGSHNVSAYAINPTSGVLTAIGVPVASGTGPFNITADPGERFLYIDNAGSSVAAPSISAYALNSATGELSALAGSPFVLPGLDTSPGSTQTSLSLHPSGRFAYLSSRFAASTSVQGVAMDAAGAVTSIPNSPFLVSQVATVNAAGTFNRAGTRYYTTFGAGIWSFDVDLATGGLTLSGSSPTGNLMPVLLTMDPAEKYLYATGISVGRVAAFAIDSATGALTDVPGSQLSTGGIGSVAVLVHRSGRFAYTINSNSLPVAPIPSTIAAFSIDQATGALTVLPGSPFATGASNVARTLSIGALDPRGRFLYANHTGSNSISVFAIDPASGQLSAVAGSPFVTGLTPSTPVPDPSGKFLFVVSRGDGTVSSYAIDQNTGALALINTLPTGTLPSVARIVGMQ
jgi:6-phosphogluconolactonase